MLLSFPLVLHGTRTILSSVRETTQIKQCQARITLESCRNYLFVLVFVVDDSVVCCSVVDCSSTFTQLLHYKIY